MKFGVLGPLQVFAGDSGDPGAILPTRLRALMAVLLWRANQPVPVDELAELVWDGTPSGKADEATRVLVLRLRRRLGERAAARIVTRPRGYAIEVAEGELDASCFEALAQEAGAAVRAGWWAQAARSASEGLRLWRGTPLADIPSQLLRDQWVPRLEQLHVQALEWRIEAELHEGRHEQLAGELRELTARHPLREHFHAQLMLALYRSGRQAEALTAYQRARDALLADLGLEPGPRLRELQQRILSADPSLAIIEPAPVEGGREPVTPRELPPAVTGFTGRSAELEMLTSLLNRSGGRVSPAVVISAIGGTAGVGKTALAVRWAHQVAGWFPDGQLYVNLRGYDPGQPMPAADALAGFLRSLGMPGRDIPPSEDERAARYRSLLAGKRMLIVLDNAGSADQVRSLLPGTSDCTVVLTSRDSLAGLVARDGAARLDLDVLPLTDAVALLRALIGPRVDAEPDAAARLARQCCRLPLALRVAAELAASHPTASLAHLAAELADLSTRLELLEAGGDPRTQVRVVFSWSYRHLDTEAAGTFRLLGLQPGPDIDPYAAAALAGTSVPQARQVLEMLARANLISLVAPGRYGMHDLLRGYARELASSLDSARQHAALTRLFDYYLHTAAAAMDRLLPAERRCRPRVPSPATPTPLLADPGAARQWLDRERATLVAVAGHAAAHGWPAHATRLAATLARYLRNGAHFPEALAVFSHALDAARRVGDRVAEAAVLNQLGLADWQLSRFQQATDNFRQALALFRAEGDRAGEGYALGSMGLAETTLCRYEQAAIHQQEAVAIFREAGDRFGEAWALGLLGHARRGQGRYQEAASYCRQSLDLSREIGDQEGGAWSLARLGVMDLRLGRHESAAGYFRQALAVFEEIGSTVGVAEIMGRLGEADLKLGRYEQAAGNFEQALAMSRDIGDRALQADALIGLGEARLHAGDAAQARAHHAAALRLASEASVPAVQARAHRGLATACQAAGDLAQARRHWQDALTRYAAIGAPEASEIRCRLATANGNGDLKPARESNAELRLAAGRRRCRKSRR